MIAKYWNNKYMEIISLNTILAYFAMYVNVFFVMCLYIYMYFCNVVIYSHEEILSIESCQLYRKTCITHDNSQ